MSKKWKPGPRVLSRVLQFIGVSLFFLAIFILLLSKALNAEINHDEHQFVASGRLLADNLLLPYKDYPYQHMPNLVFFYALIFKLSSFSLLSARIFSVVCSTISLVIIFHLVFNAFRDYGDIFRYFIAIFSIFLLMVNPLFDFTSGMSWNHDFPLMLTLLSFLALFHGFKEKISKLRILLSGILLGLAIGTRLSYATVIIPFLIYLLLCSARRFDNSKLITILIFILGLLISLLPSLALFILRPKSFFFGNIVYIRLNTLYRQLLRHRVAMDFSGKVIYFVSDVLRPFSNGVTFWIFIVVMIAVVIQSARSKKRIKNEILFFFLTVFFILVGSFAPTPSWPQYFFASFPFILLAILFGVAYLKLYQQHLALSLIVLALCTLFFGGKDIIYIYNADLKLLKEPNKMLAMKAHNLGVEIQSIVDGGKILTLSPIFPLEGGLDIYEAFATGPFTWRTAFLLSEEKREEYGVISHLDLDGYLENNPPDAILVGFESKNDGFGFGDLGGLEKPLTRFAIQHGYEAFTLSTEIVSDEIVLWVR